MNRFKADQNCCRYLVYADDQVNTTPEPFAAFESRFFRGMPQLDPALNALADVLRMMFNLYPTFYANSIVNAALQFINTLFVERELQLMGTARFQSSPDPERFPWFLRHSSGVAIGYGLMIFPNSIPLEPIPCFKAQADIDFWISGTNDLLSYVTRSFLTESMFPDQNIRYYKESMVDDETANYILNRAQVESKSPLDVMLVLKEELKKSRKTIYDTLGLSATPDAIKAWRHFERGYM